MPDPRCAMTAMSTDGNGAAVVREYSRRDFFTSGSKDVLRNALKAWNGFQEEKKKEETKLSCDEAAIQLFCKNSAKKHLRNLKFSTNRKEGK